jgi:hypothetical protein
MATAGQLRATIAEYKDDEALLWQFYDKDHAAIPEHSFTAVAEAMQTNQGFLEDLHDLVSEWMEITYRRLVSDGTIQLFMSELAELNHAKQVELYGFCTCEDGPKVWDDCSQDGK